MYDYLAKIILLGPSGCGKSSLLHRFTIPSSTSLPPITSQTIGVEFASKIITLGDHGSRRKRIKLQLWDTAGTERFRSVSRSYYRGAAGALLVYDLASRASFDALPTFLDDARALASPDLTLLLVGNKADLATPSELTAPKVGSPNLIDDPLPLPVPLPLPNQQRNRSTAIASREVSSAAATSFASSKNIPMHIETSALSGLAVEEVFHTLAAMILTKIELGEVDPDDPGSGIQYGDLGFGGAGTMSEQASIKSGINGGGSRRRQSGRRRRGWFGGWAFGGAAREWEEVFRLDGGSVRGDHRGRGRGRRRGGGCC